MSQAVHIKRTTLSGPYGEADLDGERFGQEEARCSYPPEGAPLESDISELKAALREGLTAHEEGQSDIYTLVVPSSADPDEYLPGSIEEAIRQVLDQVPRSQSAPELPAAAYATRLGSTAPPAPEAPAPDAQAPRGHGGRGRPPQTRLQRAPKRP